MKKILLLISILLLIFSCSKESGIVIPQQTGNVSFSFSNNQLYLKSANSNTDITPYAIYLSIDGANGTTVVSNEKFDLLSFGDSYITNELELNEGEYSIISFNVVNADNTVIYASPLAGSNNAQYVNNPLPIGFDVIGNETNTISPEVILVVETDTPEDYGYTSFSFTIVDIPTVTTIYLSTVEITENQTHQVIRPNITLDESNEITWADTNDYSTANAFIKISNTNDNEDIEITISYGDYENQILSLTANEIANLSFDNPYKVYFENNTIQEEGAILYFNLYQYDSPEFYISDGAYTYTTANGESGQGIIEYGQETIELPYNDFYALKFYHANYNYAQEFQMTTQQIIATENDRVNIYFDGETKGSSNNYQRLYINTYSADNVLIPATYSAYIGNLSFSQEGYLRDFNGQYIELPMEEYNELDLQINFEGSIKYLNFISDGESTAYEKVSAYNNSNNPLIVSFN